MSTSNLDAIYGQIDALPSLPAIVTNVLQVTGDPESSANDLMQAILPDQSMCATILKIANSAFFGLPRQVGTLEKAVMVLGFHEVKNIVLGKAVFNSFKELNINNKKSIDSFWEHSFTCGLAAKILAERINLAPSEMFIAGLIHDIGKLAMLLTFPNIYSHLLQTSTGNRRHNREKEVELFFISHDEVALRILKRWLFPTRLIEAVGFHHHPQKSAQHQLLSIVVEMADNIAIIFHGPGGSYAANHKALLLGLRTDIFDLWQGQNLPCTREEIATWFNLLKISREKDSAVLSAFTS